MERIEAQEGNAVMVLIYRAVGVGGRGEREAGWYHSQGLLHG